MRILFLLLLVFKCLTSIECTIGVASGKATADGRPMLWKTRDYEVKTNIVFYTQTEKYNFVSNITPAYGYSKSWFGVNDKGLAIVNTFIEDYPLGKNGPENGQFMYLALKTCATVSEFQHLLDSTNITGRATQAIFGIIDSSGNAMIFEVNAKHYWKYDANDKNTAPNGFIIKTNFTISNGGKAGIERYKRANYLVDGFFKGDSLNVKSIFRYQMRDLADTLGNPFEVKGDSNSTNTPHYFYCKKNICTPYSISATVIQGVKNCEPAYLTTMWTILGNPFSSIAIPYWPVGAPPKLSSSGSDNSLYGISFKLKKLIFNSPNKKYVNVERLMKLKSLLYPIEDSIYETTNKKLIDWRWKNPTNTELLVNEENYVTYAFNKLSNIYYQLNFIYNYKSKNRQYAKNK